MLPHMPFPNCRRLAKLCHARRMPEFGCAFRHRCNHFLFGHGFLLGAFSNKKATRQGGSDSEFWFYETRVAQPPSAVGVYQVFKLAIGLCFPMTAMSAITRDAGDLRTHLSPPHWRSLCQSAASAGYTSGPIQGPRSCHPYGGPQRHSGCWPFWGFPRSANFYCSPLSVRRRSRQNYTHYRRTCNESQWPFLAYFTITRSRAITRSCHSPPLPPFLRVSRVLRLSLVPREIVFLRQMSALVIDAPVGLETGTQQHLAHHLWDHHHADVAPQALMAAEAEV